MKKSLAFTRIYNSKQLGLFLVVLTPFLGLVFFLNLGKWLIVSNEIPEKIDYIYVFAGDGNFNRETYGISLLKIFPEAVIVMDTLWFSRIVQNNQRAKQILPHFSKCKKELIGPSFSTFEELKNLKSWSKDKNTKGKLRMALVSSPYHMRRIELICYKIGLFKKIEYYFLPFKEVYAKNYRFNYLKWWQLRKNINRIIKEYTKMFGVLFLS